MADVQTSPAPRRILLICNAQSGQQAGGDLALQSRLKVVLQSNGAQLEDFELGNLAQLSHRLNRRLSQADAPDTVVVVGGDGTLNTVSQCLLNRPVALGIIPTGTFNYLARALRVPLEPVAAARVIVTGERRSLHVGAVNELIYLNNASIGLYPYLIEQREQDNRRFGRMQVVAKLSGFATLMRAHRNLRLRMRVDGQTEPMVSPVIFFGNNPLQLEDMKLDLAACARDGQLAVIAVKPVTRWDMLQLMVRMQLGTFEQAPQVAAFCAQSVVIDSKQRHIKVAVDGEVRQLTTPLTFSVLQNALQVMVPHAAAPF